MGLVMAQLVLSRGGDYRTMKIEYYLLKSENSDAFEAFSSLNQDNIFKEHYKRVKGEELITNLFILNSSIVPFLQNNVVLRELETKDITCLPIVMINDRLYLSGSIFTIEELSELLDIGITIQRKGDD
ncbi:hypothetical protein GCM10019998_09010 [Tetragenococcus solitarius]|uniref:Arsenic metallochaperone ArsD family protein n=2 Tax=Tetragenococcus solitarius TaxID=71453 RepID=A0ABP6KKE7_9ENTE